MVRLQTRSVSKLQETHGNTGWKFKDSEINIENFLKLPVIKRGWLRVLRNHERQVCG